jgi:hypothetical protein
VARRTACVHSLVGAGSKATDAPVAEVASRACCARVPLA